MSDEESFDRWLQRGYEAGWIGPPVCSTHDGTPSTAGEDEQWEDGDDVCIHVLRLYADAAEKAAVEANHSPSRWRASNAGMT
jgi:hypothetical protein